MELLIFFGTILFVIFGGIYTFCGLIMYSGEKVAAKKGNREVVPRYANIPRNIVLLFLVGIILLGLNFGLICHAVNGM